MNPKDLTLYVITDRTWLDGAPLENAVRAAIEGGATIVQIREKHVTTEEYIARAKPIQAVCQAYGVPLIINDSLDVAKAVSYTHLAPRARLNSAKSKAP